ncbi:MAG: hypothetical protein U1C46_00490 [Bacteroidales bacterium]|nr:hypothetical protein [Bacteroidales bacterium]MDZ4203268.1 hypothetical protein [Bacteroidales bacterium]
MATVSTPVASLRLRTILIDSTALAFIYFMPALSHMLALPIYLIEPMRIMLILAIAHTTKRNAYILALTLPLFSFLISSHPVFYKSLLIALELMVNVWLFFALTKIIHNRFVAMATAIIGSKLFYYALKFGFLSFATIQGSLVSTPIYLQFITTLVFSSYIYIWAIRSNK